ncbi:MAG: hypothetical protein ACLSGB_12970 [Dorea sp.]
MRGLNGLPYLYPCLMSHGPIDYLVIMLGTNDCKERFSATPKNVADGIKRLVIKAKHTEDAWRDTPKILVVAPAPIEKNASSPMLQARWESVLTNQKNWLQNMKSVPSSTDVIFRCRTICENEPN